MKTIQVHTTITVDSITDSKLFSRLRNEFRAGDQITVCIEQTLGGSVSNVLVDFATIAEALPVASS